MKLPGRQLPATVGAASEANGSATRDVTVTGVVLVDPPLLIVVPPGVYILIDGLVSVAPPVTLRALAALELMYTPHDEVVRCTPLPIVSALLPVVDSR